MAVPGRQMVKGSRDVTWLSALPTATAAKGARTEHCLQVMCCTPVLTQILAGMTTARLWCSSLWRLSQQVQQEALHDTRIQLQLLRLRDSLLSGCAEFKDSDSYNHYSSPCILQPVLPRRVTQPLPRQSTYKTCGICAAATGLQDLPLSLPNCVFSASALGLSKSHSLQQPSIEACALCSWCHCASCESCPALAAVSEGKKEQKDDQLGLLVSLVCCQ